MQAVIDQAPNAENVLANMALTPLFLGASYSLKLPLSKTKHHYCKCGPAHFRLQEGKKTLPRRSHLIGLALKKETQPKGLIK